MKKKEHLRMREEKLKTLGGRMQLIRENAGISQEKAAEKFNVTASVLSRYENDRVVPSISLLATMCSYYGQSLEYVVNGNTANKSNFIDLGGISDAQAQALKVVAEGLRRGC